MPSKQRYYEALGVPRDASDAEIKRAYRALVRELHPDRMLDPELARRAEDRLKEINAAWNEYREMRKKGAEPARHAPGRHASSRGSSRRSGSSRRTDDDHRARDPRESRGKGRQKSSRTSTRDQYRAERSRESREREARERLDRERVEQVRRDRASERAARNEAEYGWRLRLVRALLTGFVLIAGISLVLIAVVLIASSFN